MSVQIFEADTLTPALHEAVTKLVDQLNSSLNAPAFEDLQAMLSSDTTHLLLARDNDTVVGMLTLAFYRIPTDLRAWIEDVVVDKSQRGKGVGKQLTQYAIELARKKGAKAINLTSNPARKSANKLYQSLGFELRETNTYRLSL